MKAFTPVGFVVSRILSGLPLPNARPCAAMALVALACVFSYGSLRADCINYGNYLRWVGSVDTPSQAEGVAVAGNHAYVADYSSGLQVIDISNPAAPQIVGSVDTPDWAVGVVVADNHAYVVDGRSGLQVINISNPADPQIVGSVDTPDRAVAVAVAGNHAYVADDNHGLQVIDISNPADPQIVGSVNTPGYAAGVAVAGNHAYVADYSSGLQVIDISNPADPQIVGSVDTPDGALGVAVAGNHAYVADDESGLQVIDISNPAAPQVVGSVYTPGSAKGVAVAGNHAYVADGGSGLQVLPSQCEPDLTPPDLTLGILQNPYLTQYLDIYLIGSEQLDSASVNLHVDEQPIDLRLIDRLENVWLGDYKLSEDDGVISVTGCASDTAGKDTCVTASFSSSLLYAERGGSISSLDGRVSVNIDPDVLLSDTYLILLPCRDDEAGSQSVGNAGRISSLRLLALDGMTPVRYYVGPRAALGSGTAYLEFHYTDSDLGPQGIPGQLHIVQEGIGPLESYVDPVSNTVGAEISEFGEFRLASGTPATSTVTDPRYLRLHPSYPNPFSIGAAVRFEVRAPQHVRATVHDVTGRVIARLLDEAVYPGIHQISWDGRGVYGSSAASGVYFIRMETEHSSSSSKILKLR